MQRILQQAKQLMPQRSQQQGSGGETTVPRPLGPFCSVCSTIDIAELPNAWLHKRPTKSEAAKFGRPGRHHPSFASLQFAAAEGCSTCCLFLQELLSSAMAEYGWTEERAIQYHHFRDEHVPGAFELRLNNKRQRLGDGIHIILFSRTVFDQHPSEASASIRKKFPEYLKDSVDFGLYSRSGRHEHVVTRAIDKYPDADLCSRWIRECSSGHEHCQSIQNQALPTRLIDVGAEAVAEPKLRETGTEEGQYVALSHLW